MNRADEIFAAGFRAALGVAHVVADKIAAGPMPPLRRELAATALRSFATEAEAALNPPASAVVAGQDGLAKFATSAALPSLARKEQRAAAIQRGYVGDPCRDCGNFTLVRNGTCLKCDTCGSTTGCS